MTRWGVGFLAVVVLALAGCGTGDVGAVSQREPAADRQGLSAKQRTAGVSVDGFEVLRYDREGFVDAALNGTIGVKVAREGGLTAVTISISDPAGMDSVIVNVNYDAAAVHPERAEFCGLLGDEQHVLSAAFLDSSGTAGLCAAPIRGYRPGEFCGDFATVYFADGPCRNASSIGDVHSNPYGVANLYKSQSEAGPQNMFNSYGGWDKARISWTAGWNCGDGDENGETNPADLVPMAKYFTENTDEDWSAAVADYDLNTEVNAGDIVRIATFFGERTTSYLVEASDDDGTERTEVTTINWDDAHDADPLFGGGDLRAAYKFWEVNFDDTTTFTYSQLIALDKNVDGWVTVYVTPVGANPNDKGAESSIDVGHGEIGPKILIITGYDIEMIGATDGAGGDVFDGDGESEAPNAAVIEDANSQASFQLDSIRGTYEGADFDKDNLATSQGMTQSMYDDALASARENLQWTFDNGGASGFRRSSDWITLDDGNPNPAPFTVTGDPGQGTVFPDDDPESVGPDAEGKLTTLLPYGISGQYLWNSEVHVQVYSDVTYNITVDIQEDEKAPTLLEYGIAYLPPIINSQFSMQFEWGDGGDPGVYDDCDLRLERILLTGVTDPTGGIDFNYVEGEPVNGGEFTLDLTWQPTIECIVPGTYLQQGSNYAFRFFDGSKWSSLNKPEELLPAEIKPTPPPMPTVPPVADSTVKYLQIFYDDPVVRRNAFFTIDLENMQVLPEDEDAYFDVLKINGDEFPVNVAPWGDPPEPYAWPQIRVGPPGGSNTPVGQGLITGLNYEGVQGILIPKYNGNRLIVDISVLTEPPEPGGGNKYYAYRLFSADGSGQGGGEFMIPALPISVPGPTGVGWGINAINREELLFSDMWFDDKSLDSSTVGTPHPDMIWAQFIDGWVFSAFETPADRPYENVHLHLMDQEPSGGEMDLNLGLRAAGLFPSGSYVAIHEVVRDDYYNVSQPGFGILRKGHVYDVALDDDRTPGLDYEFPDPLVVTGDLPPE